MSFLLDPEVLCLIMFLTTVGLLLTGFPVAFVLAGTSAAFAFIGYALGVFDLGFLSAFPQRIFQTMSSEVLVAVPLFVFMGVMLERSKVAEELLDNMGRMFGSLPGGLAFSVCVVGALLAASTGIVGATVVTMGLISLPTMLRRGYSRSFSCGTIAASGTLGQVIPPSIVLVLLGDQLSSAYQQAQFDMGIFAPDTVSVNDLFAGALLPGLLLVGMYMLYQLVLTWLRPELAPAVQMADSGRTPREQLVHLAGVLFAPIILIVAVLGSILGGLASPTEAAGVGAVGAMMLAGYKLLPSRSGLLIAGGVSLVILLVMSASFDLRLQRDVIPQQEMIAIIVAMLLTAVLFAGVALAAWRAYQTRDENGERVLLLVMRSTMTISSMVFIILVGAGMFSLVFRGFGGDEWIEEFLSSLPGGAVGAVLLVMLTMFVMGFFLDFLEIIFIVVPIVAPILLQMEIAPGEPINPVWLGVMMAINLQTSFLTPPFGFALFYLRGVAPPEVRTIEIYKGIIPFVIIQLLALIVLWYTPEIATWLPVALYGQ
ncbi:TRAP transporter large permease [Dichotomicrobium thermohalophilum]|uniref:Tripartite ATP-independent transporter DctM subunit n=1 Tax=Dichotomicrobium thermohalophilum TaxID=933063 RepID=A0A397Q3D0_9HYPH|nr:TRAP transporter large permease subunit [Dichotomicrobium thermohalophilum]RIA55538.1 tripartite ATP-independent transporter DctM subunit [Dichotomicrobium thermohalophilum]